MNMRILLATALAVTTMAGGVAFAADAAKAPASATASTSKSVKHHKAATHKAPAKAAATTPPKS